MSKPQQIIVRGVVVIGSLIAVAFIANALVIWSYSSAVEERLAKIRADGHPVTLADLAVEADDQKDDAARILAGVKSDVESVSSLLEPLWERENFYQGRLNSLERRGIHAAFATRPNLIATLRRAADASDYNVTIENGTSAQEFVARISNQPSRQSVAAILATRAVLLSAEGKPEKAMETCLVLFRLCRQFDEPTLVAHLTSLASRGVAIEAANVVVRGRGVTQTMRDELETELARHDVAAAHQKALRQERALGITTFREAIDNTGFPPTRWKLWKDMSVYLDAVARPIAVASQPFYQTPDSRVNIEQLGPVSQFLVPAVEESRKSTAQLIAKLRCLRILNALQSQSSDIERVSADHFDIPAEALRDPFTGEPLRLSRGDDGPTIYSVGRNGRDDGGDLRENLDIGVEPPAARSSIPEQNASKT